tara:strand:+ start:266 stop:469 length:204 start_codon:yes stop_codon:yes gene_type:complete
MTDPIITPQGDDSYKIVLDRFDTEFFITKEEWQRVLNFCQINKITTDYYMYEFMLWEHEFDDEGNRV